MKIWPMLGSNPRLIFPILFTLSLMLLERSFGFSYSHRNLFILGAICKSPISHVFRDHQTMPKSLKYINVVFASPTNDITKMLRIFPPRHVQIFEQYIYYHSRTKLELLFPMTSGHLHTNFHGTDQTKLSSIKS